MQVKVITEIRKNEKGDRVKVERTVKVRCAPLGTKFVSDKNNKQHDHQRGRGPACPVGCRARCAGAHDSRARSDHAGQVTKKLIRVNNAVRGRRSWAKFGDCEGQEVRACLSVHAQGWGKPLDGLARSQSRRELLLADWGKAACTQPVRIGWCRAY